MPVRPFTLASTPRAIHFSATCQKALSNLSLTFSRRLVAAPAGIALFPRHAPTAHAWSVIKDSHIMHASYPQRIPPSLVPPYKGGNAIPASCHNHAPPVRVLASHTLSHRARVHLRRRHSGDTTRACGRTGTHDAPGRAPAAPPLASRSPQPHALGGLPTLLTNHIINRV